MGMFGMGGDGGAMGMPGGGPLGAMGMDLSLHKMPVIGGFFQNPAEIHKQQQFHDAGRAYSAYRPESAQAHMNALGNRLSTYQGAANVLAAINGGQSPDMSALMRQPMGPSMMQQGITQDASQTGGPGFLGSGGLGGMLGGMGGMGGLGGLF